MKYRSELLVQLLSDATKRCALVSTDANYPSLLTRLLIQALIKIEENEVVIYCRSKDLATVNSVLPNAIKDFVKVMKDKAGVDLKPKVTVNQDRSKVSIGQGAGEATG